MAKSIAPVIQIWSTSKFQYVRSKAQLVFTSCYAGDLGSIPGLGKSPREGKGYPVFWPGEFHGLCNPWRHKESDTTEWLSLSLSRQSFTLLQHSVHINKREWLWHLCVGKNKNSHNKTIKFMKIKRRSLPALNNAILKKDTYKLLLVTAHLIF